MKDEEHMHDRHVAMALAGWPEKLKVHVFEQFLSALPRDIIVYPGLEIRMLRKKYANKMKSR